MGEKKNVKRMGKFLWVIPVLVLSIVLMSIFAILMQNGEGQQISKIEKEKLKASNPATSMTEAQSDDMLTKTVNSYIQDAYGNQITIPAGFKIKVDDDTNNAKTVDKGIVIIDKDENEFVWVPVGTIYTDAAQTEENAKTIELNRYTFDENGNSTAQNDAVINSYYQELEKSSYGNATAKSITNFKKSVEDNKGYYIGRYEARRDEDRKITEKGTDSVDNMMTQEGAATAARNMYDNTKPFISDLINSYAWDTATLFLQTCGTNTTYSRKTSANDSLATTGTKNQETEDVQCNVYDMASNLFEWSTETCTQSNFNATYRGGNYYESKCYPSTRRMLQTEACGNDYGYRPILYIEEKASEWEYTKLNDTEIEITKYLGADTDLVIPDTIDGYTVTSIANYTFTESTDLQRVYIPDSVTTIGDKAFPPIRPTLGKDSQENVIIICNLGSAAEQYAKDKDMSYIYKDKTITGISVTIKPDKITYLKNKEETLDVAGGRLTVSYAEDNLTSTVRMRSSGIETSGFNNTAIGANTITVAFEGQTTTFDITITAELIININYICNDGSEGGIYGDETSIGKESFSNISGIKTIEIPDSITTIEDNTFEGNEEAIIICNPGSTAEQYAKEHDMGYMYKGQTITGILVETNPTKMTYIEGKEEDLDVTEGRLTVKYSEPKFTSSVRMTSSEVETSGFDNTKVGQNAITVEFKGKTAKFEVTITAKRITKVEITKAPDKTTYKQGETEINLAGGELTVTYDNGKSEVIPMTTTGEDGTTIVTSGVITTPAQLGAEEGLGNKEITVSYKGVGATGEGATIEVNVIQKDINYEENTSGPEGTPGITITKPTTPGEGEEGNKDVVIPSEIEGKPVTEIGSGAFAKPVEVETIEIPDSVTTIADDAFTGNEDAIIICDPGSAAEQYAKDHNMSYIYKGKTITGISVLETERPTKVEYLQGKEETLDVTGGKITVTYAETIEGTTDGTGTNLTSKVRMTSAGVATSGFNNTVAGSNTISVTFREKDTTFDVTITAKSITKVELTTAPSKTTYKEGDTEIDLAGGELTVTYDNGTSEVIPMVTDGETTPGVKVNGFNTTEIGNKEITISYNGVEATVGEGTTLKINVIQKTIDYEEKTNEEGNSEIIITRPTQPGEGEEGNKDVVIPDEIDGKDVTEIGDKAFAKPAEVETIEIPDSVTKIADDAFEGNEDAIIICNPGSAAEQYAKEHDMSYIYKDKTITGISVSKNPDKISYLEGKEELDVTGGRLTVTCEETNEAGENLTSKVRMTSAGVATSGFDNTVAGTNKVTVTFREQPATFDVTITANIYTITFAPGENATVDTSTKEVTNGQEYGELPNATKEGHTFVGWYTEDGSKIDKNTIVNLTSNITLYARYEINKYTVTFKNDDGTTIKTVTTEYGSKVEFDGQTPTKNNTPAGYEAIFNGWTGVENLESVTANTTVTATYTLTPIVYTITYENTKNSDISDTTKFPTSYTVEDLNIRLEDLPNQEKLIFKGWYTTNDETGNKVTMIDISKLVNITVYARWEQVQEQEDLWLSSDVYKIGDNDIDNYEEGDIYLEKIMPETTVAEFIENCESNGDITVINERGQVLGNNDLIGTNMTIKITGYSKEITLTAVVMGDLDGNGLVTVTDLSGINQTVLRVIKLEGAVFKAADLDDNNEITVTDLSGINQKILKVIEFRYDKKVS